ncbi:MAG TPA: FHA domain-containing protein [Vicinamibacterales bacterium]|nr:FHA domain-containing protein [Vicinamibacterales bacterium]
MAKLLIFRGDTQLDERELTGKTLRIGRASQNDLVLEDPGKGVSRNHAEIRFEGGRYTLVDLGSQNGLWVSGSRVPSVVLEPGVSVAVGPYRLMMEAPVAVTPAGGVVPISDLDTGPIEPTQFSAAVPLNLESLGPAPKTQDSAPKAIEQRPAPVVKESARKEGTVQRPVKQVTVVTQGGAAPSLNVRILVSISALVLLVVLLGVGYKMTRKPAPAAWDASVAQALIASGKCQEALDRQINPALQRDPSNQQATTLRDECNRTLAQVTSVATSSIPPATPTADDRLNEAESLVQTNVAAECQKGLDIINAVAAEDANNQRAKDMAVRANACLTAIAKPGNSAVASAEKPAVPVSPSQGGLDVIQGETDKAYKTRMGVARKKYDDAVAVLAEKKYAQALNQFNELLNEVPSGYLELQAKRDEARAGMRAEGKAALEAAQVADGRDSFDVAIEGYRRAHQLDPSIQVDAAIKGVSDRKLALGRKRCTDGITDFAIGNTSAAITELQEAVRLLPQSDPCFAKAKEALQKIQK